MTDAERRLWRHLRQWPEGTTHFRRQAAIGPYFVDFACHSNRLVIEVDGGHHASGQQEQKDSTRDAFFEVRGYRVLRFWNHDVMNNIEGVLMVIANVLNPNAPHP